MTLPVFMYYIVCNAISVYIPVGVGTLQYNAQSPDEAALVAAAKNFGYVFKVQSCEGFCQININFPILCIHRLAVPSL